MKILIIRHGDPDYSIDSLTEKGWREAEYLAQRMEKEKAAAYYVSPLGRARDTAKATLEKTGKSAEALPWLREFDAKIKDIHTCEYRSVVWDMLPEDWTREEKHYDKDKWFDTPQMREGNVEKNVKEVWTGLDSVLEKHGYKRENNYYRVNSENEDTIAFFCHFGVECVMLAHLLNVSAMVLWHGFMASPTSVTTLISEERRQGIAYFRARSLGDVSHLYANKEEPAFAGRFCEIYSNTEQRH